MANLLKKIEVGNPLINLEMWNLYEEYQRLQTDQQIADFHHKMLDMVEVLYMMNRKNPIFEDFIYNMISFSTGADIDPVYYLMQKTLCGHED